MSIYIIHTCELGQAGTKIRKPSKEQIAWALKHKFLCNVTIPMVKPKPRRVLPITPKPEPEKIKTEPFKRPLGRPPKRIKTDKE